MMREKRGTTSEPLKLTDSISALIPHPRFAVVIGIALRKVVKAKALIPADQHDHAVITLHKRCFGHTAFPGDILLIIDRLGGLPCLTCIAGVDRLAFADIFRPRLVACCKHKVNIGAVAVIARQFNAIGIRAEILSVSFKRPETFCRTSAGSIGLKRAEKSSV